MIVLWDIDGTLLHLEQGPHERYFAAVRQAVGHEVDLHPVPIHGHTEAEIMLGVVAQLGLPAEAMETVVAMSLHALDGLALTDPPPSLAVSSAETALVKLTAMGARHSVVTGNTFVRAYVKLSTAGIVHHFDLSLGAFGDESRDRSAIVGLAVQRARRRDPDVDERQIVVIGDTPLDAVAARKAGVPCILVGAGAYTMQDLEDASADLVIEDFERGLSCLLDWFGNCHPS